MASGLRGASDDASRPGARAAAVRSRPRTSEWECAWQHTAVSWSWGSSSGSALARADVQPHLSEQYLPSSNGMAAIAWDRSRTSWTSCSSTRTRRRAPRRRPAQLHLRQLPGRRACGTDRHLARRRRPDRHRVPPGHRHRPHERTVGAVQLDEYDFAPMGLAEYASVMLVEVTADGERPARSTSTPSSTTSSARAARPRATTRETITYDATHDAFYETGPARRRVRVRRAWRRRATTAAPRTTRTPCSAPARTSTTTPAPAARRRARWPASRSSLGSLATATSAWVGWLTVLAARRERPGGHRARAYVGRRPQRPTSSSPTRSRAGPRGSTPPPSGASAPEAALDAAVAGHAAHGAGDRDRQRRTGRSSRASPRAQWNITWVRDMAYATVGLVRSGHYAEAKAAHRVPDAARRSGAYEYVRRRAVPDQRRAATTATARSGATRTPTGRTSSSTASASSSGSSTSTCRPAGDTASLAQWWPTVKSKVARRAGRPAGAVGPHLAGLVHLGGALGRPAEALRLHDDRGGQRPLLGLAPRAGRGRHGGRRHVPAAGQKARTPCYRTCAAPAGTLAQSTEALAAGTGWLDASVLEAINFGLIEPTGPTAQRDDVGDRGRPRARERSGLHAEQRGRRVLVQRVGVHRPACRAVARAARRLHVRDEPLRLERGPGRATTSASSRSCTTR